MKRYKVIVQYDGLAFNGWQTQKSGRTIQGEIELALSKINKSKNVRLHGAGRTDTGVHATGQVAHFDLETSLDSFQLKDAINGNLSGDIRIMSCEQVSMDFHARFSAIRRHYNYRIRTDGFMLDRTYTWIVEPVDIRMLNDAARIFIGEHDFTSFSKNNEDLEHHRCIVYESIWKAENQLVNYSIIANRFLHHMIRYLVGTMIEIARGNYKMEDFIYLFNNPQKNVHIFKAPSHGLVLCQIDYDKT